MLKRYEWKILQEIKVDHGGSTTYHKLAKLHNWEEWKTSAVKKLIEAKYIMHGKNDETGKLETLKLTFKGKLALVRYANRFGGKRFKGVNDMSTTQQKTLDFKLKKNVGQIQLVPKSHKSVKKSTFKVYLIIALILYLLFSLGWEIIANNSKIAKRIGIFLIIVFCFLTSYRKKY